MANVKNVTSEDLDALMEGGRNGKRGDRVHNWDVLLNCKPHLMGEQVYDGTFVSADDESITIKSKDDKGKDEEHSHDMITVVKVTTNGKNADATDIEAGTRVSVHVVGCPTCNKTHDMGDSKIKSFRGMAWQTAKRRGMKIRERIYAPTGNLVIQAFHPEPSGAQEQGQEPEVDAVDEPQEEPQEREVVPEPEPEPEPQHAGRHGGRRRK